MSQNLKNLSQMVFTETTCQRESQREPSVGVKINLFFLAIFKRLYELPSNASVILKNGFENFLFIHNLSNKLNLYVTSLTLP